MKANRPRSAPRAWRMTREHTSLIHFAKTRLGLTEVNYRALLRRTAGVESSRDLTEEGFDAVMKELRRLGFVSTATSERRKDATRDPYHSSSAQRARIRRMWDEYKGGKDPAGLRRWLDRHFGVSDLKFLSIERAQKVIGALSNFAAGGKAKARATRDKEEV